jgi:hypothetical protein
MATNNEAKFVPNKRMKNKRDGPPKRPISSFLSFSQLIRSGIRDKYPNMKNADISSVLAQRWQDASEEAKRPHIEREQREKENYDRCMTQWKEGELDRVTTENAQHVALKQEASQLNNLNHGPSLWASMTNIDGTSSFNNGSRSPLYEPIDGFWDTELEGGDNQYGCSTGGSEKSSDDGNNTKNTLSDKNTTSFRNTTPFHPETTVTPKAIKRETPLTTAKKSKVQRIAKHAAQKACKVELPLTAQQLEIQQRTLQQLQQFQMFQMHMLNQRQSGLRPDLTPQPAPQQPLQQAYRLVLGLLG